VGGEGEISRALVSGTVSKLEGGVDEDDEDGEGFMLLGLELQLLLV
jgi:hypothetical protein